MQEIDQTGMASPTTKGSWMITDPDRIPNMISHAGRVAFTGRRGPVHLTIPVDVQQMEVSSTEFSISVSPPKVNRSSTPSDQIREVVKLMRDAHFPLIVLGSTATYSNSGKAFEKFIEVTKFPLMTEGDSRGLVPDSHQYSFGFFDMGLNKVSRKIREADLIILMGRKQDLIIGYATEAIINGMAKIIQINPDGTTSRA